MSPSKEGTKTFPLKLHFLFGWLALIVYLFVSAPAPLYDDAQQQKIKHIPINQLFVLLQEENNTIRKLWTKEILGAGKKQGLKFSEDWQDRDVEAGPLPALFLREIATRLEKNALPLSLFLGSDAPINKANAFDAEQLEKFKRIKEDRKAQFFYAADIARHIGMFPDIASVSPCISCHNEHKDSPKTDWKLLDVMGATTWLYPKDTISITEALTILSVLREKFKETYAAYLTKVQSFSNPPKINEKWPREGYFLPTTEVFMHTFETEASMSTLLSLLQIAKHEQ
ncbi:Adenylate cyclase [hydrothermal vent metagenome]|uniref:Adenylate cyclase n=1 Tax=hydrothermal vent metagenome TaxID=652676 RepID=A0A3B1CTZ6_9ZZZZ